MIKFVGEFKVTKLEEKSVTKRDGTSFDFTEATLEEGKKFKNYLVARVKDGVAPDLHEGQTQKLEIEITSWKRDDGKIWNNFVIRDVIPESGAKYAYDDHSEIPF